MRETLFAKMRNNEDIYTILVGLGLVIYGVAQIAFKVRNHKRWVIYYKSQQLLERSFSENN